MKYFTCSNAIANGQNCFFIKQVSIAMLNYRRTNIERVNAIINTVLSIAFSCRNRAEVFCLPLFPSKSKRASDFPWPFCSTYRL